MPQGARGAFVSYSTGCLGVCQQRTFGVDIMTPGSCTDLIMLLRLPWLYSSPEHVFDYLALPTSVRQMVPARPLH